MQVPAFGNARFFISLLEITLGIFTEIRVISYYSN